MVQFEDKYFPTALEAAKRGGEVLRRYWGRLSGYEEKSGPGDLVTEADTAAEKVILEAVREAFSDHAILSEESGLVEGELDAEYLWAIDPLDGTTNYAHQYPMVAVSIALIAHGVPHVGVVYNPISDEMFCAVAGQGVMLNGRSIKVSDVKTLGQSLLATGFVSGIGTAGTKKLAEFAAVSDASHGVRRDGSAALDLCYVAAGRLDGFWETKLKIWDIAAGALCVLEGGGVVTATDGAPIDYHSGHIAASNGKIHDALLEAIQGASFL